MAMSDDIRVRIDDDDDAGSTTRRSSNVAKESKTTPAESELNRAFAERAYWQNQLLQTRRDQVAAEIQHTNAAADAAEAALKNDLEMGDFAATAKRQREISQLETRRQALEDTAARLNAQPTQPADPVEAYAQNRTEPTQKWLREHRDFVTDPRKNARLTAAHWNAVAEGLVPDTENYFEHVEKAIGLRDEGEGRRSNESGSGGVTVRKARPGDPIPPGAVKMSRGEYEAATDGTLRWGYDDSHGRFKKDDPIGIREYVRRKQEMIRQGNWFNRPDSA
jgi:hypothetical protein